VQRALREAIIDGRLSQGEALREVHIARMLGTGRGPVREAVRQLVQEGLVEYRFHRGAFIRVLTVDDAEDIYLAREAIEVCAVVQVLELDDADPSSLRQALEDIQRSVAKEGRPSAGTIDADLAFHRELVQLARSVRLSRAYETLAAENRMILRHHPPYPSRAYVRDHEQLLAAVVERRPETPDLVRDHLRISARLITEAMVSSPSESQSQVDKHPGAGSLDTWTSREPARRKSSVRTKSDRRTSDGEPSQVVRRSP
jgi:DNA-binding GntR family transcriptional regulator